METIEPRYRVVPERRADSSYHYTAAGPGLGYHKPYFETEGEANTFCVSLTQAFKAGKQARSREFARLIDDDGGRR